MLKFDGIWGGIWVIIFWITEKIGDLKYRIWEYFLKRRIRKQRRK